MNTDKLFQMLSALHPLSDKFKDVLEKEITILSLPNHHLLLEAPRISSHIYFLNTGFAMSYIFINGRKHVESFWKSEQLIMSPKSLFEQTPSQEFIQLMEPASVVHISHAGLLKLMDSYGEASAIYCLTLKQYLEHARERIRDMQYLSAQERYQKLNSNFPRIEQIISQETVASYLGIAPQSLSRIKRNAP